jgi:GDP-4-dehydro-6-deoxy-D-mannose reductase
MKILITGVNGFVGPYLAKELHPAEIVGIDTSESCSVHDISYYKADLLDVKNLHTMIGREKPNIIFHLAGISSVQMSWSNPELTHKINAIGTKNLLNAITSLKTKFIFISTAEVYGIPEEIPINELHAVNPQNPYAKSKLEAEQFVKKSGFSYIILRSFQHIGPGQKAGFVCADFAQQIAEVEKGKKEHVIYVGNLDVIRDFTDVRDVVKAYALAMTKAIPGEIYNIASGNGYVIKDILDIFLSMSSVKIQVKVDPHKMRPVKIPRQVGDYSKFFKQTGWKPKITLAQSLKDILNYWREII